MAPVKMNLYFEKSKVFIVLPLFILRAIIIRLKDNSMFLFLLACQSEPQTDFPISEHEDEAEDETEDETVRKVEGQVRFVAIGDAGEGNDAQYAVADVVERVCSEQGCDFAIYLGDNFYDVGVDSVEDVQFIDKFELPYENLEFPFYVALGNHDYGGAGHLIDKPEPQVEYTQ